MRDYNALWETSREKILDAVSTDLDTALTFTRIAANAESDFEKKSRNQSNARSAYDTTIHWLRRLEPNADEAAGIHEKLAELRMRLEELGERF